MALQASMDGEVHERDGREADEQPRRGPRERQPWPARDQRERDRQQEERAGIGADPGHFQERARQPMPDRARPVGRPAPGRVARQPEQRHRRRAAQQDAPHRALPGRSLLRLPRRLLRASHDASGPGHTTARAGALRM